MTMKYEFSINDTMALAATKVGIEGWQAYQWEAAGDDHVLRGCVPSGVYATGPRKGRPRFTPATHGTERTVVVSRAELIEQARRLECAEGKCWDCKGTGHTIVSVSVEKGHISRGFRACRRCGGSGLPFNA